MILVLVSVALCVVIGAIIPAVIMVGLAHLGLSVAFPVVVILTAAGIAGVVALLRLVAPDPMAGVLDQREEAVSARERDMAGREQEMTTREDRHRASDARLSELTAALREQVAEQDRFARDLDARASALYRAEAEHKAAAAELAERIALFDAVQTQATILEARNRLDDERAALRDERAALTGERIALSAAETLHATRVREHAAAVKAAERKAAPKRAAKTQGAA